MGPNDKSSRALSARFAIWQICGGVWKPRIFDNFSCSRLNASVESRETYRPEPIDAVLAMDRSVAASSQSRDLRAWRVDFAHAYKHSRIGPKFWEVAPILIHCPTGGQIYVALRADRPFG